ncbi:MAG: putative toxin-antitoxin system toxin component, PIN family [Thermoanaerobaculia bacterium]
MKVVLDTNVLIAAFTTRGLCSELLERVLSDHELIVSTHLLVEFERVLVGKFGFTDSKVKQAVALLRRVGVIVEPGPLDRPVCRDPDDDLVLALGVQAGAKCIVTGDRDLLDLERLQSVPILSPRDFWILEGKR